jgi:hypothetical protein
LVLLVQVLVLVSDLLLHSASGHRCLLFVVHQFWLEGAVHV